MKLWLIRHAPVLLPTGVCYGATDVRADNAATEQAAKLAAEQLPNALRVWVSGLQRAQQLAKNLAILRPELAPAIVDPRLNEMDFGCWEMQPWNAIPQSAFDAWLADFDHHCFGGVESTDIFMKRVASALADTQRLMEKSEFSEHCEALWITHAGVIRAVQWIAENGVVPVQQASNWPNTKLEPGALCIFEIPERLV